MGYENAMMGLVGIAVAGKVIQETEKTMRPRRYSRAPARHYKHSAPRHYARTAHRKSAIGMGHIFG